MKKIVLFLCICLLAGMVCGCSENAPPAEDTGSDGKIVLKVGTCAPESSTFVSNTQLFGEKLSELSGGTMEIDIAAGGALGNIPQHFSQLNEGTLDIFVQGLDAPSAVTGGEDFNILNVPFLFDDTDHFHAFVESDAFDSMMESVKENNAFSFLGLIGDRPARSLATNKHAVRTPDDLKDLLIRVPESPIPMAVWQAWGASTTTSAANAIFEGLQTGQFDGQENGIETMVIDGFMAVQDYYMAFDHTQQGIAAFISDATVDKLTDEQYGWIVESIAYALEETSDILWNEEVPSYYETMEQEGVEIVYDIDIDAFRAIVDELIPTFEGEYFRAGLYDEIRALAA